jgi:hypothetical protein
MRRAQLAVGWASKQSATFGGNLEMQLLGVHAAVDPQADQLSKAASRQGQNPNHR